jgi:hypothetical protein
MRVSLLSPSTEIRGRPLAQVDSAGPVLRPAPGLAPALPGQDLEQIADLPLLDQGMTQRQVGEHLVVVAPALALAPHVALFDQLGEDLVGAALGDADRVGDVAQAHPGVVCDAEENVGVVGEEVPAALHVSYYITFGYGISIHESVLACLGALPQPMESQMRRPSPPTDSPRPSPTAFRPRVIALATGLALLLTLAFAGGAQAATAIGLGTADSFAVLAGAGVTNTGPSVINGDLGTFPNPSVTGFGGAPNGTVNGATHQADAAAASAQGDLTTAYNNAAGQGPANTLATELGGQSLTPGVYKSQSGTFGITGALTLNAQGNPNAVFIFQTASTLISASASQVNLINGAQPCNVYWKVGSSATLGTSSTFAGNILALESISLNNGVAVLGRLLARNASVTLINDTVTRPGCTTGPSGGGSGGEGGGEGGGGNGKGNGNGNGNGNNNGGPTVQVNGVPGNHGTPAGNNVRVGGPLPCVGEGFRVKVRVHGSTGIRRVEVFLDGKLVKRIKRKVFSVWIDVDGLRTGRNTVRVEAVDRRGRRDVASQSFRTCALAQPAPSFTG